MTCTGMFSRRVAEYDAYNDGSVDSVDTVTNTYDARGHLLTTTSGNSSTIYTYDEQGREAAFRSEVDFDGDGVVDYVSSFSRTYDPSGNIVGGVYLSFSADGSSNSRTVTTSTFGPNGTELSTIVEADYEDDGVIDERYTATSTYNSQGRVLVRESVLDHFVYDDWDYVSTETMTVRRTGKPLEPGSRPGLRRKQRLLAVAVVHLRYARPRAHNHNRTRLWR